MGFFSDMTEIQRRFFAVASILLIAFFPLGYINLFIEFVIGMFIGIGNALLWGLITLANFVLGGLANGFKFVLEFLAVAFNNLIDGLMGPGTQRPLDETLDALAWSTIPFDPMTVPDVNLFPNTALVLFLLEKFGVSLPL